MKSLAIIGMMFCSVALFAQQQEADTPKKEKVCVIERGEIKKDRIEMKKAPIRHVNERKTSVKMKRTTPVRKADVQDERMIRPLERKSSNVNAKR